jgi:hypothetical protein
LSLLVNLCVCNSCHNEQHTKSYSHYCSLERGWTGKACRLADFRIERRGFDTLLVTGKVPEGEEDMSYFADEAGVKPLYIPEMSREISLKDGVTFGNCFALSCANGPTSFTRTRPRPERSDARRLFISLVDAGTL